MREWILIVVSVILLALAIFPFAYLGNERLYYFLFSKNIMQDPIKATVMWYYPRPNFLFPELVTYFTLYLISPIKNFLALGIAYSFISLMLNFSIIYYFTRNFKITLLAFSLYVLLVAIALLLGRPTFSDLILSYLEPAKHELLPFISFTILILAINERLVPLLIISVLAVFSDPLIILQALLPITVVDFFSKLRKRKLSAVAIVLLVSALIGYLLNLLEPSIQYSFNPLSIKYLLHPYKTLKDVGINIEDPPYGIGEIFAHFVKKAVSQPYTSALLILALLSFLAFFKRDPYLASVLILSIIFTLIKFSSRYFGFTLMGFLLVLSVFLGKKRSIAEIALVIAITILIFEVMSTINYKFQYIEMQLHLLKTLKRERAVADYYLSPLSRNLEPFGIKQPTLIAFGPCNNTWFYVYPHMTSLEDFMSTINGILVTDTYDLIIHGHITTKELLSSWKTYLKKLNINFNVSKIGKYYLITSSSEKFKYLIFSDPFVINSALRKLYLMNILGVDTPKLKVYLRPNETVFLPPGKYEIDGQASLNGLRIEGKKIVVLKDWTTLSAKNWTWLIRFKEKGKLEPVKLLTYLVRKYEDEAFRYALSHALWKLVYGRGKCAPPYYYPIYVLRNGIIS